MSFYDSLGTDEETLYDKLGTDKAINHYSRPNSGILPGLNSTVKKNKSKVSFYDTLGVNNIEPIQPTIQKSKPLQQLQVPQQQTGSNLYNPSMLKSDLSIPTAGAKLPQTIKPDPNPFTPEKVVSGISSVAKSGRVLLDKGVNAYTFGLNDLMESKMDPTGYSEKKKRYAESPIASTVGTLLGSISPGMLIEKGIVSGVKKLVPNIAQGLSKATKFAGKGLAGGAGIGFIEGTTDALSENKKSSEALGEGYGRAKEYGMFGGLLSGAIGKIGSGIDKYLLNKKLGNIDNAYAGYKQNGIAGNVGVKPQTVNTPTVKPITTYNSPDTNTNTLTQKPIDIPTYKQPLNVEGQSIPPIKNKGLESQYTASNIAENSNIVKKYENIKTAQDLPDDVDSLKEFISLKDNPEYKLMNVNLKLFGEAEEKISKFYSNTIKRAEEIPDHIKAQIDPKEFNYQVEKVVEWENSAKNNVMLDRARAENDIRNSISIDGGVKGHESAEIMRKLIDEGDPTKVIDWLKVVSSKSRETARGLKSIDSAYPKYSKEYQLLKTQKVVDDVEDSFKKMNPKMAKDIDKETSDLISTAKQEAKQNKKKQDAIIDEVTTAFNAEQQRIIDNQKETIDALRDQTRKLIDDAKVPKDSLPAKLKIAGETNFPEMLKNKIISALKPKDPEEVGTIRNMIKDLFEESKQEIRGKTFDGEIKKKIAYPDKLKPKDESIKTLADSYNLRGYKNDIRNKAIDALEEEFKNDPDALEMLKRYRESGIKPPHSEKLLNDILGKRVSGIPSEAKAATATIQKPQISAWVKDWYATGRGEREKFVDAIMKETGLTGDEANSLKNLLDSKMKSITSQTKNKMLENVMATKQKGVQKSATDKLTELTNFGLLENKKFSAGISEKISPIVKQVLKDKGLNFTDIVNMSLKDRQNAKSDLLREVFRNTRVDDNEINKLIGVVKKEFETLTKNKQNQILEGFTKERTNVPKTMVEKISQKINQGVYDDEVDQALRDAVKEKYKLPTLSNDDVKFIVDSMDSIQGKSPDDEFFRETIAKVEQLIENKKPASFAQKLRSWNVMSMLGNAASQAMNFIGNTGMATDYTALNPLRRVVDSTLGKVVGGNKVTGKLSLNSLGKGYIQGGRSVKRDMLGGRDFKDIKNPTQLLDALVNPINTNPANIKNGKFETNYNIPFKSKSLRAPSNILNSVMGFSDRPFEQAYRSDLINALAKNNSGNVTQEIKDVADKVSADMTFKSDNIVADALSGLQTFGNRLVKKAGLDPETARGLKGVAANIPQIISQGLLPFAKTPANIAMKALEYSPLGIARGVGKAVSNRGTQDMLKRREVVDLVTRGLAGTGLYYGGKSLDKYGYFTGDKEDNANANNLMAQKGTQPDALKIGKTNIDLKRFYPFSAPILAGKASNQGTSVKDSYLDSIGTVINNYTDNSLLQNVAKAAQLFSSDPRVDKAKTALSLGTGIAKQSIPSLVKKAKFITDKYDRNANSDSMLGYVSNQFKKDLPILSEQLPAKLDYQGNPIKSYGGNNSFLNVNFNPIKVTEEKNDPVLSESLRLYGKFGETSALLPDASKTRSIENNKLTQAQQDKFQKLIGNNLSNLSSYTQSSSYQNKSDDEKADLFEKKLRDARNKAKKDLMKSEGLKKKKK